MGSVYRFSQRQRLIDAAQPTLLTANRSMYVSKTGSDLNDGLAPDRPKLTIQAAVNAALKFFAPAWNINVYIGAGTYTENVSGGAHGLYQINLIGDIVTPANVEIDGYVYFDTGLFAVSGVTLNPTSGGWVSAACYAGGVCTLSHIRYKESGAEPMLLASNGGEIFLSGSNHVIAGDGAVFAKSDSGGLIDAQGATITVTGRTFSSVFAACASLAFQQWGTAAFTGTFTGKKYQVDGPAMINTNGGGANFFPGSIAGSVSDGGVYS